MANYLLGGVNGRARWGGGGRGLLGGEGRGKPVTKNGSELLPLPVVEEIFAVRGTRVILDVDLARIYGVEARSLNQAVKRNASRFPRDFAFQLTSEEFDDLRSQSVISRSAHGGRRYLPWAFTEHGAIMAATLLNSSRAVEMSVFVVRVRK